MSMLGSDKLTHAVKDKNLTKPGNILTELNNSVKSTLKQNETDSELPRHFRDGPRKVRRAGDRLADQCGP